MPDNLPVRAILRASFARCRHHPGITILSFWPVLTTTLVFMMAFHVRIWWAVATMAAIVTLETYLWVAAWHRFIILDEYPTPCFSRREWRYFRTSFLIGAAILMAMVGLSVLVKIIGDVFDQPLLALATAPAVGLATFWLLTPLILTLPAHAIGLAPGTARTAAILQGQRWRFMALLSAVPAANLMLTGLCAILPPPFGTVADIVAILSHPVEVGVLSLSYMWLRTGDIPARP
ncbi:MAG TPA: hypothetical protein VK196_22640 [Magnetospirillum sp.]|nr:hypothetical protein [Magnetospirillum sp.]